MAPPVTRRCTAAIRDCGMGRMSSHPTAPPDDRVALAAALRTPCPAMKAGGTWELIDGLQRISTILEFMGTFARLTEICPSHIDANVNGVQTGIPKDA